MKYMMIFHAKLFPVAPELQRFNCSCGRTIFKANAQNITVMNDIGLSHTQYEPSQQVIEVQCHSCKNKFTILYQ